MRPALDLKRALRVYVLGHDAGYDIATKLRIAADELETERLAAGTAAGLDAAAATSASADDSSVPVPEQLDFHRAAGTWRDHIPGLRRGA
ncbi:MAG: hypothetical protein O7E50_02470 [Gemmatimonadetes bacterium]|nr:hypothetical protein [Gemmatimonadota bacterium]